MESCRSLKAENARLLSEIADTERLEELNAELEMLRAERVKPRGRDVAVG